MKDNDIHYPKEPILFGVFPGFFKTTMTMCGKRRELNDVTDIPNVITCGECGNRARAYWTEQKAACETLIRYAENGELHTTGDDDPLPKLRTALFETIHIIAELPAVSP
jgi:hypothetical protein